uniref:Uncharacterized protein K0122H06.25 n=1 Tax=Oryza sativa subsp. indica TaxID=39946 RepID=C8TFE3_ORYSI|nr:hypothetical protein [Oryza sativa Indica Group]
MAEINLDRVDQDRMAWIDTEQRHNSGCGGAPTAAPRRRRTTTKQRRGGNKAASAAATLGQQLATQQRLR